MKEITNTVLKLGDGIETIQILPEKYLRDCPTGEMAEHVFEEYGDDFPARIQGGGVLVAGSLFGCGPGPARAAAALKAAGVSCLIAKSFGRSFFREAVNNGLPLIVADIVDKVNDGDGITINLEQGEISCPDNKTRFAPFPEFVLRIMETGSLAAAVEKELGRK